MVGLVDVPYPQALGAGFSIFHQKVELDIDLLRRSLRGKTELSISPHNKDLRVIRLNCRQCELKLLTVNGKPASSAPYTDPYKIANLPWDAGVHQYHMLRRKLEGQLKDPPEEELIVNLPKNFKIEEQEPDPTEGVDDAVANLPLWKKEPSSNLPEVPQSSRTEQPARFAPITLRIEYVIHKIRDGMHFVGWEEGDLRYPHAYSRNSILPGDACCLFPCADDRTSRSTWDISIKCARSIGDALRVTQSKESLPMNGTAAQSTGRNGNHGGLRAEEQNFGFSEEDQALDLAVICTGDMTDEMVDPLDPTKKTTSFHSVAVLAARHIGFAIGPFEHIDLAEFRESDEDDKLGQNAVPVHGFCLPGRVDETKNTCLPLAKAVDFFTLTYGTYPFPNYKLCFVDDLHCDIVDTSSLSICSSRLLFPEDIIEPLDQVSRQLVHALASQWMGIDIVPKEAVDTWVVVGIAYFMTDVFIKKLSGNNEYRFRQKKASGRVLELDVARPSLYDTGPLTSLDPSELDFMAIKAPLVLFILDRRLTKTSGSSGLSRIISRVLLNARVGDMPNGAITTAYFTKTCEKLGHAKLDVFFTQWIFNAGCPEFRVSQRFNKKKLVVEMMITQTHRSELTDRDLDKNTFMRDVKEELRSVYAGPVQPVFTGPMTIRIHEADGTPYEHIIEIKEGNTKFDIPYNTKYKRLKRSRRQKERSALAGGIEFSSEGIDDVLIYCLGDILQSDEEVKEWRLSDWSKDDEDKMNQESYEWIRMDADFEWICRITMNMPGYMYTSQLQQDRDVVAQLESVQHMASQRESPLISSILLRTLLDRRYFHGIRTAAAAALAKNAKDELNWIGLFHLEKAFQEFFCFTDSPMTRSNDFSDRTAYYIQCAIPRAIAKVRDNHGRAPMRVRNFLFEKLKFNDNSNNEYSDCHYIAVLMNGLADALSSKPAPIPNLLDEDMNPEDDDGEDVGFHDTCIDEIDRYRRLDEWIPSYHNILSTTALDCKLNLIKAGATPKNPVDFLQYTRDGTSDILRLKAFCNLMELGMFKNDALLRWFLFVLGTDPSPYVRQHMLRLLGKAMGFIAIGENSNSAAATAAQSGGLIIEQESSTEGRQADLARKQTVVGALQALKDEVGMNEILKKGLWNAVSSPAITLRELVELLELCELLYAPESSMIVVLKYPRYWKCTKVGKATLRFSQTSRIRTRPLPARPIPVSILPPPHPPPLRLKLQLQPPPQPNQGKAPLRRSDSSSNSSHHARSSNSSSNTNSSTGFTSTKTPAFPRPLLKPPKKPSTSSSSGGASTISAVSSSTSGNSASQQSSGAGGSKPKLTLKLSLKGAGGGSSSSGGGGGGSGGVG